MIDCETLGNGKHAALIQIGACYFNRATAEIGETFKANIDARSSVQSGAEMDADTVYWWMRQSKEAIESVTKEPLLDLRVSMNTLNLFLRDAGCIWSHAAFDFVILMETFKRLKISPLFHYRACRDIRTLVDLAGVKTKDPRFIRQGVHHDALDDCLFQVQYCTRAFKMLGVE